jgi:DNA polymerase-3 subunit gamma/tau
MSYQVLARRWRPRSFEQMVGQSHVLRALINALNQGRLHHAYLFTGTRGVGKTTLGRILAKCLNCEAGVSAQPCGACSACRQIDQGRFVDLVEVDAASRTKVEDTRELLDNIQYSPAYGRYKVYLIDEVHMLSSHSFNALLKTLEEPPPHVKFILATTDPQRLPATVLSRCLQFNLRRMSVHEIVNHLRNLLQAERVPVEEGALAELARAADGSMRDALSLLDQAIGLGSGAVNEESVCEMLGAAPRELMHKLAFALADSDGAGTMQAVGELADYLTDVSGVLVELLSLLHQVALAQSVPDSIDDTYPYRGLAEELARKLSVEDVQLYYQIALLGRRDLPLAPDPRTGLEMALLRMLSFKPVRDTESADADEIATAGRDQAANLEARGDARTASVDSEAMSNDAMRQDGGPTSSDKPDCYWPELMQALTLDGLAQELASNCSLKSLADDEVSLVLESCHVGLRAAKAEDRLRQALCDYFGRAVRLRIAVAEHAGETPAQLAGRNKAERQSAAVAAIEADATVRAFKERFDAEVLPGSVRPISD